MPEFTVAEVAPHKTRDDLWITIHGKVYNVTDYVRDHPGGVDVLIDVAGTDATAAYEDVGHSEDADEILSAYLIGTLTGATEFVPSKAVRLVQQVVDEPKTTVKSGTLSIGTIAGTASVLTAAMVLYYSSHGPVMPGEVLAKLSPILSKSPSSLHVSPGGFSTGFVTSSILCTTVGAVIADRLSKFTEIKTGFASYPPHKKSKSVVRADPHLTKGFLDAKEYRALRLVMKDQLSPNVYRFVFQLPDPRGAIGLPIGQHVAIKATVDGTSVSRSYTPTSNNLDLGKLEMVIKCYPQGLLTGRYLANLEVGDKVLFRGPKGAMRYKRGICTKMGMVAGGTGITPMYQLIRAICEDDTDTTEISLVYANRTEEDILLRNELEGFARRYPKNLKIWYMLDDPPPGWAYGKGHITPEVLAARLPRPSPDTKVMLCGPPGMVNAARKGLVAMGFEAPGSVAKMTDQIFAF